MRRVVILRAATDLLFVVAPTLLFAQQPRTIRLDRPEASVNTEWTSVIGVRELPDGRVIILDYRDQVAKLVDFKAGTATRIGGRGSGPGEYVLPTALFAIPGDSTLIYDEANSGQPMLVSPRGAPAGTVRGNVSVGPTSFIGGHNEVDGLGRFYRVAPFGSADRLFAIERLNRATGRIDTVEYVRRSADCSSPGSGPSAVPADRSNFSRAAPSITAFPATEQWAVSLDGRVAVACPDPYRVRLSVGGQSLLGSAIAYAKVPVTEAEKQAWGDERAKPVAVIRFGSGGRTAGFEKHEVKYPDKWPATLPAFLLAGGGRRTIRFGPDGTLWVERAVAAGAEPTYDLIGRDANLLARVVLQKRSRIVGFGGNGIYVVSLDDDDIEHLSRFRFPAMNNR